MDLQSPTEQIDHMVAVWSAAFKVSKNPDLYATLIHEEATELLEVISLEDPTTLGYASHYLKEYSDLLFVLAGFRAMVDDIGSYQFNVDTLSMLEAVGNIHSGFFARVVPNLQYLEMEAFRLVFESNMSKLDVDGNPIFREDGKIMKGPNYKEPDLTELATQLNLHLRIAVDMENAEEAVAA